MYMYYTYKKTTAPSVAGTIRFRIHVIAWGEEEFRGLNGLHKDIDATRHGSKDKIWFLCDYAEEICVISDKSTERALTTNDFIHLDKDTGLPDGVTIVYAMRNSIPKVRGVSTLFLKRRYQHGFKVS